MKVTLISHACVVGVNQQKLVELAKFPDIQLVLVAPGSWKDHSSGKHYKLDKRCAQGYRIVSGKTTNSWKMYFYFYYSGLFRHLLQFKPDIVHIDEEPCTLCAMQGILYGKLIKAKTIIFSFQDIAVRYPFPFSFVEKYCLHSADYAIAGTEAVREVLVKKGFQKSIKVIPHGFDSLLYVKSDEGRLRQEYGLTTFTIGYVGRLVKEKGLTILLRAVAKIAGDYQLFVVGEGPLRKGMIRIANELDINEKLIFAGNVAHRKIPQYLNCMDLLVLPSITTPGWQEQLGRVLIEAMACEVPVIGSSSGEIPKVIGDVGLIFKEKDPDDLGNKIKRLMMDEDFRLELIKKGRQRALNKYTWRRVAERIYEVYQELMKCGKNDKEDLFNARK